MNIIYQRSHNLFPKDVINGIEQTPVRIGIYTRVYYGFFFLLNL